VNAPDVELEATVGGQAPQPVYVNESGLPDKNLHATALPYCAAAFPNTPPGDVHVVAKVGGKVVEELTVAVRTGGLTGALLYAKPD
jgi:hypothetical protein